MVTNPTGLDFVIRAFGPLQESTMPYTFTQVTSATYPRIWLPPKAHNKVNASD